MVNRGFLVLLLLLIVGSIQIIEVFVNSSKKMELSDNSLDHPLKPEIISNRFIVFWKEEPKVILKDIQIIEHFSNLHCTLIEADSAVLQKFLALYSMEIKTIVRDQKFTTSRAFSNFKISKNPMSENVDYVQATHLRNLNFTGEGIRVGIIDSGLDSSNKEIAGRIVAEKSFVQIKYGYSSDINSTDDEPSHGTWVAGIIGGNISGIAPNVTFVNAKIFSRDVKGNGGFVEEETTSAVIAAIDYCLEQECDIINLSFGQYFNMAEGLKELAINRASKEGVVVVISAGNQGVDIEADLANIGNPGTSLQAITVGAYSPTSDTMATFSSHGPRYDYSIKPDLVAPGVGISASGVTASGTSASAPAVSGVCALLIEGIENQSMNYTPGTIKAAVIATAKPLNQSSGLPYPEWVQGRGKIRGDEAYYLLVNATPFNTIPSVIASNPIKMPFSSMNTYFLEQTMSFNLTVVNSGTVQGNLSLSPSLSPYITVPSNMLFSDTVNIPIRFYIPYDSTIGSVNGNLTIKTEANSHLVIPISFEIRDPNKRILFDERHTTLTTSFSRKMVFGDNHILLGQYFEFYKMCQEHNYSLTPFQRGRLNRSYLTGFDILLLPNPCSYISHGMTDWINPALNPNFDVFNSDEILSIQRFVEVEGRKLLVFTQGIISADIEGLNDLLMPFGIGISSQMIEDSVSVSDIAPVPFLNKVKSFSYSGALLTIDSKLSNPLAYYSKSIIMAARGYENGGRVLVLGTEHFIVNYGLLGHYGDLEGNHELVLALLNWKSSETDLGSVYNPSYLTSLENTSGLSLESFITGMFLSIIVLSYMRKKRKND